MKCTFALRTIRQTLAATAVMLVATTVAVAQNNPQSADGENQAANAEKAQQVDADQAASESDEASTEDPLVLEVIELKSMRANDFRSAAELMGVVERRAASVAAPPSPGLQAQAHERVFIAIKPDSSLLFVRGPKKKVDKVVELAKKLDVSRKEMPKTLQLEDGRQARLVPQEQLNEIREVLGALGFSTATSSIGDASFLIYHESEKNRVKQIDQVIDKLSEERGKKEDAAQQAEQEGGDKEAGSQDEAENEKEAADDASAAEPETESEELETDADE